MLCVILFAAGHLIAGIFTILLTSYGCFRHSSSIGQRAQQIVRRPSAELRRIMAIDRQRKAIECGSLSQLYIRQPAQNPYMQRAKLWFYFCAATLVPAFLLSLACADQVMLVYLIPPSLIFVGGMARFLGKHLDGVHETVSQDIEGPGPGRVDGVHNQRRDSHRRSQGLGAQRHVGRNCGRDPRIFVGAALACSPLAFFQLLSSGL